MMGAMLNVQLDRHRRNDRSDAGRKEAESSKGSRSLGNLGLKATPMNSADHDCATQVMYTLPSAEAAKRFVSLFPSVIVGKTGRHTYIEWDQVLMGAGAAHPAMNPFDMPANAECRKAYSKDMCKKSLDILDRTVMVATHPKHSREETSRHRPQHRRRGARRSYGACRVAEADFRATPKPVDAQKFDLKVDA